MAHLTSRASQVSYLLYTSVAEELLSTLSKGDSLKFNSDGYHAKLCKITFENAIATIGVYKSHIKEE